jgi:uncharacterized protein YukJ
VAVNVLSQEKPAELLYVAEENFRHPVTQSLPGLYPGPGRRRGMEHRVLTDELGGQAGSQLLTAVMSMISEEAP